MLTRDSFRSARNPAKSGQNGRSAHLITLIYVQVQAKPLAAPPGPGWPLFGLVQEALEGRKVERPAGGRYL